MSLKHLKEAQLHYLKMHVNYYEVQSHTHQWLKLETDKILTFDVDMELQNLIYFL